jgi:hypothetical protein
MHRVGGAMIHRITRNRNLVHEGKRNGKLVHVAKYTPRQIIQEERKAEVEGGKVIEREKSEIRAQLAKAFGRRRGGTIKQL